MLQVGHDSKYWHSSLSLSITVRKTRPEMAINEVFKHITVKEIHPTFAAEVRGISFSSPIADDVFAEILAAMTDESHVAFARKFGELDDIEPYITAG